MASTTSYCRYLGTVFNLPITEVNNLDVISVHAERFTQLLICAFFKDHTITP